MGQSNLLAILAHPDDEAYSVGGTLLKYARQGVTVHIVIATDGAEGSIDPSYGNIDGSIVDIRKKEMEASAKIIGANLSWLNYRDSGMQGDPANQNPNALINADKKVVIEKIANLIKDIRPQVIITHDENGGYFHPDHIFCYKVVTAAVEYLNSTYPDKTPIGLFYHVLPKWWVLIYALGMLINGENPKKWGRGKDIDVTKAGTPSKKISAKINIRDYWSLKRTICAQHLSQGGDNYIYFNRRIPTWLQKKIFGVEFYVKHPSNEDQNNESIFDLLEIN